MTDQEQNIAVALACPRDMFRYDPIAGWYYRLNGYWTPCLNGRIGNDLNAMHEAEKALSKEQMEEYGAQLMHLETSPYQCYYATARQRREAFLRTTGQCKE